MAKPDCPAAAPQSARPSCPCFACSFVPPAVYPQSCRLSTTATAWHAGHQAQEAGWHQHTHHAGAARLAGACSGVHAAPTPQPQGRTYVRCYKSCAMHVWLAQHWLSHGAEACVPAEQLQSKIMPPQQQLVHAASSCTLLGAAPGYSRRHQTAMLHRQERGHGSPHSSGRGAPVQKTSGCCSRRARCSSSAGRGGCHG